MLQHMAEYQYLFIYLIFHSECKQMALSQGDTELNWATDWLHFIFARADKWETTENQDGLQFIFQL